MYGLRSIAAVTLFAFTTILSWSAAASVLEYVESATACCCEEDAEPAHTNYATPGCECPACVCSVQEAPPSTPWNSPTQVEYSWQVDAPDAAPIVTVDDAPLHEEVSALRVRGPPLQNTPPLYLLHDTLLI